MTEPVNIVWFRQDLRVEDNPALAAAAAGREAVVPLFIFPSQEDNAWAPSEKSLRRQRESLAHLAYDLEAFGAGLVVRSGEPQHLLGELMRELPVKGVYWNRRYEPHERAVDDAVRDQLRGAGVESRAFDGNLLFAPGEVRTTSGGSYRVFTPFWRACLERQPSSSPHWSVTSLAAPRLWPASTNGSIAPAKDDFDLSNRIDSFLGAYTEARDRPDLEGTSRLSARLHFGELGPRQLWRAVEDNPGPGAEAFLRQLVWREFAYHLLFHFPDTTDAPMRREFNRFPWRRDEVGLEKWKLGQTGYPIVDAGMRQLARTGWMHNRVRMVAASFLVKHLLIDWRLGARHFWETLEDADLANNTLGWQWVAGSGADAAPYFRIFNPVRQGERFDPAGEYVRAWLPELAALPSRWIHKPWMAPRQVLTDCGVRLNETYPDPIVDHEYARHRALAAYASMRKK
jgi:deoxyribodipyrimidine photo-lyase